MMTDLWLAALDPRIHFEVEPLEIVKCNKVCKTDRLQQKKGAKLLILFDSFNLH